MVSNLINDRKALSIGIVIGGIVLACVFSLLIIGGCATRGWETVSNMFDALGISQDSTNDDLAPTPTPHVIRPTDSTPIQMSLSEETLYALENTEIPINDPNDLAQRLLGIADIPETYPDLSAPHDVGDQMSFWVTNTSTNTDFQTSATLRYVTDHAYFWVGDSVSYKQKDLEALAEDFENHIYPTTRAFFGSEWTPGIDEDPHIYILYVSGVGRRTAGYFSSADLVHPLANDHSNAHEIFVFNADNSPLNSVYTYGVLSHEFQHLIHWYRDRNESSWINEGFSELATLLSGYDPGGWDYSYVNQPDLQLNDWPNDNTATGPHYGASFLFLSYFLDRMGEKATQLLVENPENGLKSIDLVLEEIGASDSLTGQPITADDLVLDWVITNFLRNSSVGDGRFTYYNYPSAPQAVDTESIRDCNPGTQERNVHQYGVDYVQIICLGQHTLVFEGSVQTGLLPANAYSGDYSFWSNKGDESDMTLTQTFDFTEVSAPITLSYWTWYDIEEDYDYVYLTASMDGENWDILTTPSGTGDDPTGSNYSWGYNGLSGDGPEWIQESVDISQYAGQQVQLRFEYITDAAVNGEGLLVDDIAIPAIDYFTDFEEDNGGWVGAGFVRVSNILPQTFRLALITRGSNTTVDYFTLDENNSLEISLDISGDVDDVVLVVVGTTRYTRQLASYRFGFLP